MKLSIFALFISFASVSAATTIIRGFENLSPGAYPSISYPEFTVTATSFGGDLRVTTFAGFAAEGVNFIYATKSSAPSAIGDGNLQFTANTIYTFDSFSVNGVESSVGTVVANVNMFADGGASLGSFNIIAPGSNMTPVAYTFANYTTTPVAKFEITNNVDLSGFAVDKIVMTIPEPSSLLLGSFGAFVLVARRRRTA